MSALQSGRATSYPLGCTHPAHYHPQPRSPAGQALPERLFRASKASSSRGITMLSNRPRSVGATTLLPGQKEGTGCGSLWDGV